MQNNPFDTSKCSFKLSFQTEYQNLLYFEDFLEFAADSTSFSEVSSKTIESMPDDLWLIEAFFDHDPSHKIRDKITKISEEKNIEIGDIIISKVEDIDWVTEVQKNFLPFAVGRFFITSKFYEDKAQEQSLIPLVINPSRAFGTGEHQTTKACIESLEFLSDKEFARIADVGTGTGILAIAAQKIWSMASVIGSDIEEISCEIAKENSLYNNCPEIQIIHSDGYKSIQDEKFDLIISNILLKPLLDYAEDLSNHLNIGGYAVLSGFLKSQEDELIKRFQGLNFDLVEKIYLDEWVAIVLCKK